jgi:hypothetical protein
MAKRTSSGTEFHVVIEGVKLSADAEKRIETEIRKMILAEIATTDFKGDLQISPVEKYPKLISSGLVPPGRRPIGIWISDLAQNS